MPKLLSREAFLATKLPFVDLPVPELGPEAVVRVQQMSVNTRVAYLERVRRERQAVLAWEDDQALPEKKRKGVEKPGDFDDACLAIVLCVVDEADEPLFTEQDILAINGKSQNAVTRIWNAVQEINWYDRPYGAAIEAEKKG